MTRLILAALAMATLTACPPIEGDPYVGLYAVTGPPPSREARVRTNATDEALEITLSSGVAMAVRCSDSCDGACVAPRFDTRDEVLQVHDAYLLRGGPSAHVLVGGRPGVTELRVSTGCAEATYRVTVVE